MKKKIFAAAGASLAVAAVPVMGVFAATSTTDTVQITVTSSCEMTVSASANNTYTVQSMSNGETKSDIGSTTMSVSCNNAAGWSLSAVGAGELTGEGNNVKMKPSVATNTPIDTGTSTTGASTWAFKLSGTAATASFQNFSAIPVSSTPVAGTNGAVSGSDITTMYQVHVGPTQQADTYTGKVTYTLAPISS